MCTPSPHGGLLESAKKQTKTGYSVKFKFQNKQKKVSVSMEKPGHTYTPRLFLVYLKLRGNWMSCLQTLGQADGATTDGIAWKGHSQAGRETKQGPLRCLSLLPDKVQRPRARPTHPPASPRIHCPPRSCPQTFALAVCPGLEHSSSSLAPPPSPGLHSDLPARTCWNPHSPGPWQVLICSVTVSHSPPTSPSLQADVI